MSLTVKRIAKLIAPGRYLDADNLYLQVKPNGACRHTSFLSTSVEEHDFLATWRFAALRAVPPTARNTPPEAPIPLSLELGEEELS
jgi:hypothetical protein